MADNIATRLSLRIAGATLLAIVLALAACSEKSTPVASPAPQAMPPMDVHAVIDALGAQTRASSQATVIATDGLVMAVKAFLANPNGETRAAYQQAWVHAHTAFAATRALLLVPHDRLLFQLDAWPIQPGFLDSLPDYPESGIINDVTITIDADSLKRQNGITDSEEVSLGFHPLEYYAFDRPVEDFINPAEGQPDPGNIARRRAALLAIAETLQASVETLVNQMDLDLLALTPPASPGRRDEERLLAHVLGSARSTAHQALQEANLLVSKEQEHCQFSKTSMASLATEMQTFRDIVELPALMKALRELDARTAANLEATLKQTGAVLNGTDTSETDRAKLPLMLSAVNHQLEDLSMQLDQPAADR